MNVEIKNFNLEGLFGSLLAFINVLLLSYKLIDDGCTKDGG